MIDNFFANKTIVAVKNGLIFGDEKIRYAKIAGWNLNVSHEGGQAKTELRYQINLLKMDKSVWIPADCITGFLKGV